jgi:GINS complex subunit 4
MEIDRLQYMVSSYLRTRLRKIEKFALHLLSDAVLSQRLSQKELNFAKQYVVLFETHVNDLALGKFAEEHRSITSEGMSTSALSHCLCLWMHRFFRNNLVHVYWY